MEDLATLVTRNKNAILSMFFLTIILIDSHFKFLKCYLLVLYVHFFSKKRINTFKIRILNTFSYSQVTQDAKVVPLKAVLMMKMITAETLI